MRQFRFRAWHPEDKVMVYDLNSLRVFGGVLIPDDYKLMQFTGLKDKYGEDVFEGDVLQCIYANEEEPEIIIGKVEFDEEEAVYILIFGENKDYLFNMQVEHYAKVIGNIYINPELLEEK